MPDLLPDSRMRDRAKGRKGARWHMGMWWVPVYCANCGTPYGYVPEQNCDFACWLCNKCQETHGQIANTMQMPDEVFWKKVEEAQLEHYAQILGPEELLRLLEEGDSPLAKLMKEKVSQHVRV
jgi:hypothetical protein